MCGDVGIDDGKIGAMDDDAFCYAWGDYSLPLFSDGHTVLLVRKWSALYAKP
jgi:hypothetical protein